MPRINPEAPSRHPGAGQAGQPQAEVQARSDGGVCLGRTCLSWQADGELSPTDVHLVLERLCLVDVQACQALHDAG